ncbi:mandelate racemase/muconate lactonizing enzyme family protein [Pseudactinotalea sp. Z1748]|uniref:mandelate racemase/muconate lactonizing enzyme family protein n=1 Tax=Pseudactinotalea sp. Z1748 TaxID=3413027 RepID=UPI003C7A42F3
MKITEVRSTGLRGGTPEGGWSNELQPDDVVHTLIAIETDTGHIGVGSCFTSDTLVHGALEFLKPFLVGEDPRETERVTEKLHRNSFWLGRGGAITHTISGIDTALWDLLGQFAGLPTGVLLGGRYRESVLPYASVLMQRPELLASELKELAAAGFRAFKIGWGDFGRVDSKTDETIVAAAREAVGEDALLAVDAGGSDADFPGRLKWAIRTSKMLADYSVAWFEEALPPDLVTDFAELRRQSPVPIAGGEVLTRRQAFLPFLSGGAFDIVQPDVTKGGGLSDSRRIGWMASELGVKLIPHGWNTAIGLAADLQLASALPETDLVEYKTGSAYIDDISENSWELDARGRLAIPTVPGLGYRLSPEGLEKYATDPNFAQLRGT